MSTAMEDKDPLIDAEGSCLHCWLQQQIDLWIDANPKATEDSQDCLNRILSVFMQRLYDQGEPQYFRENLTVMLRNTDVLATAIEENALRGDDEPPLH